MNIKDWTGEHPVSGTMVVGSIVILTKSNNLNLKTKKIQSKNETTQKSEYEVSDDIEGEVF